MNRNPIKPHHSNVAQPGRAAGLKLPSIKRPGNRLLSCPGIPRSISKLANRRLDRQLLARPIPVSAALIRTANHRLEHASETAEKQAAKRRKPLARIKSQHGSRRR